MSAAAHATVQEGSDSLGIHGVSIHRRRADRDDPPVDRGLRFELLSQAQSLLYDPDVGPKQQHPTCWCGRGVTAESVRLRRRPISRRINLRGVQTCKRPWVCAPCAGRIAAKRQAELEAANVAWQRAGGFVHLLSYTFPHSRDQSLEFLGKRFAAARQSFANCKTYRRIRRATESPGVVRAYEVTVGELNGWHPHLHELLYVRRPLTELEKAELLGEWVRILLKVGLGDGSQITDMMDRALDIRGGEDAAAYVAKFGREEHWGLSSELTLRNAKRGSVAPGAQTYKPFALLALAGEGNQWAAARFLEYAKAFERKRLLTWSRELRKAIAELGIEVGADENDDGLEAEVRGDEEQDCAELGYERWRIVVSRRAVGQVVELLSVYGGDREMAQRLLDDFVDALAQAPPRSSGKLLVRGLFGMGLVDVVPA